MSGTSPTRFNVCLVCALPEEFDAFEKVVSDICKVSFRLATTSKGRPYKYTTIHNTAGASITLHLSLPVEKGPEAMALHLERVLEEFQPEFVAMAGICAGDRRKVKLGDLVVAVSAFSYERGKWVVDEDGQKVHLRDTRTYSPDATTQVRVGMFRAWQHELNKFERPFSKRQQLEWLLSRLLEAPEQRVDTIPRAELEEHAPNWRKIVADLQRSSPPTLSPERKLFDSAALRDRFYGPEEFPFVDPKESRLYPEAMASGSAVRSDDPFDEVQIPVRGAVAIDMESATFYRVVAEEFPGTHSLVVKGVCDYADSDKDDSYHLYASQASAAYLLRFIQEYISGSIPRPPRGLEPPPPTEVSSAFKLYFCCAPEDAHYRKEIEKQLVMLVRLGRITHWQSYDPELGAERAGERMDYLRQARIIPLLLSPDLLMSESFTRDLQQAYEQYAAGRARVIPVLLRQTNDWERIPFGQLELGNLEPLPHSRRFLVGNERNLDEAFAGVATSISGVVKQLSSG
jgi:nucleoside phosphorylase